MDYRIRILNEHLKRYDRDLFAKEFDHGMVQIFRKTIQWFCFEFEERKYSYSRSIPIFVIALTHNWLGNGQPVEWGVEPLLSKLKEMDAWRSDSIYDDMVKDREYKERTKKQSDRNDMKARAADIRKDFARAFNDVNTSTLEKIDKRRIKDGHC